ncbi:hypothetical protein MSG28_007377 [Choristoneura fumiferana]|uniref:Uncharacterized protein n=1 Tax=Choristoneura fumiferana TaxID=7141 RepID=A0ACC0JWX1_CHOFU|nr:hypothetical protein MSG28_007377 [Choristoneura fumiferana]
MSCMPVMDSCSWHGFSVADAEPAAAVSPTSSTDAVSLRTDAINIDARHYTQDKYHVQYEMKLHIIFKEDNNTMCYT